MEQTFPAGAMVDSALVTTGFDPDDSLSMEQFSVWVVSPTGTEVLIYDGFNLTELEVDEFYLTGVEDETAEGTWKVKIERLTAGAVGTIEECGLEVYYRY